MCTYTHLCTFVHGCAQLYSAAKSYCTAVHICTAPIEKSCSASIFNNPSNDTQHGRSHLLELRLWSSLGQCGCCYKAKEGDDGIAAVRRSLTAYQHHLSLQSTILISACCCCAVFLVSWLLQVRLRSSFFQFNCGDKDKEDIDGIAAVRWCISVCYRHFYA